VYAEISRGSPEIGTKLDKTLNLVTSDSAVLFVNLAGECTS
jgi:hypothetical protein